MLPRLLRVLLKVLLTVLSVLLSVYSVARPLGARLVPSCLPLAGPD